MKKIGFLILICLNSFSQDVKTQEEIVRENLWNVFYDIPGYFFQEFYTYIGSSKFNRLVNYYNENPENSPFKVFNGNAQHLDVNEASHPAFINTDYDFKDIVDLDFGICSGLTYITRKFHQLAYFDVYNSFNQDVPSFYDNHDQWVAFYKKKINDVFSLKPTIIPYFPSFYSLTKNRFFKEYLKKLTLAEWVKKNVSMRGLIQLKSTQSDGMSPEQVFRLFRKLTFRLSLGYKPIVYLAKPSDSILSRDSWIHVLNVTRVELVDRNTFRIHLWDINERAYGAHKIVEIGMNGKISGSFGSRLVAIYLYPQDDSEVAEIVFNKIDWCAQSDSHKKLCFTGEFETFEPGPFNPFGLRSNQSQVHLSYPYN